MPLDGGYVTIIFKYGTELTDPADSTGDTAFQGLLDHLATYPGLTELPMAFKTYAMQQGVTVTEEPAP